MNFRKSATALLAILLLVPTAAVQAAAAGDWILRVGVSNVRPNDSSGDLSGSPGGQVAVDGDTQPSVTVTYMLSDSLGIEVLASLPFTHDINGAGTLAGAGKVGETSQLPPTVSLQHYFSPQASTRPYVGIGLNYTTFFDESTTGALAGTSLKLDDSFGIALQAGVDVDINPEWFFNADLRYIQISTTATTALGTVDVDIDPWVFTLGIGTTF